MFSWPDDIDDLRSRVEIRFDVLGEAVATGSTPVMSTIKVASPCYEMDEEDFRGLLGALRRHHTVSTEESWGRSDGSTNRLP
jgi:hypothetical protein